MPQICCSVSQELFNILDKRAQAENSSRPKVLIELAEKAIHLEVEVMTLNEQLGLALQNQRQFQEEIMPPLKLLMEPKSRRRWQLFHRK